LNDSTVITFYCLFVSFDREIYIPYVGADPGFHVRGADLRKLRRAEGGANIFGVFHVKNHDFTPKNLFFSNCGGRRENCWGILCEKSRFNAKKSYFSNFSGAPLDPPLICRCYWVAIISINGISQKENWNDLSRQISFSTSTICHMRICQ
jgi:hypothetical protein